MVDSQSEQIVNGVLIILFLVVSLVGIVGNMLSLVVFSRPKFANTIFSVYFRFSLLLDTYVIVNASIDFMNYQFQINMENFSVIVCRSRQYLVYAFSATSAWLSTIITFNRMIDVVYPTRYAIKKRKSCQIAACLAWSAIILTIYSPISFDFAQYYLTDANSTSDDTSSPPLPPPDESTVNDSSIQFDNANNTASSSSSSTSYACTLTFKTWLIWLDLFCSTVIPFTLMTSFIFATLMSLSRRSKEAVSNVISRKSSRQARYGLIVILIDVCFLVFNLPLCVANFMISPSTSSASGTLFYSVNLLWYMNFAVTFFINFLANKLFKSEFDLMIHMKRSGAKRKSVVDESTIMSSSQQVSIFTAIKMVITRKK